MELMRPYENYKETGVAWLEKVPSDWSWLFLSQVASEQKNKNSENSENNVLSLSYGNIIKKKNINFGLVPKEYDNYQIVNNGNIILRLTDLQNDHKSLRTGLVRETGIITSAYTCIKPKINSYFLQFVLHSFDTQKVFYGMGGGVRQSIGYNDIRNMRLPVPPRDEQDQIVKFLDWKTSKINALVTAKKKQIELLKEQKQAVINQAVTKGLDPSVPMKDSGVEWLGDVPEHWEVCRVKNVFHNLDHKRIPVESTERGKQENIYDYYGASGIIDKVENYIFDDELLLIAEDGANLVLRNLPLCIIAKGKFWVNNHAHILKAVNGDLYFYYYFLEMVDYKPFISGAAQPKLTQEKLQNILVLLPPFDEQQSIVRHLEEKTFFINKAIVAIEKEIELVNEYKTSLISSVVTGKVDVRDAAVPAFEVVEEMADGVENVEMEE